MPDFADLVAEEMFLPARVYHKEFLSFARDAVTFLNGLPNKDKLTAPQAVDLIIRAQAAGLLPPMPQLDKFAGDGSYAVDTKTETTIGGTGNISFSAITLGLNYSRTRAEAVQAAHHVSWEAQAIIPASSTERLQAIVEMSKDLAALFAAQDKDRALPASTAAAKTNG